MMTKNNFNCFILVADCNNPKIYDLLSKTSKVKTTIRQKKLLTLPILFF